MRIQLANEYYHRKCNMQWQIVWNTGIGVHQSLDFQSAAVTRVFFDSAANVLSPNTGKTVLLFLYRPELSCLAHRSHLLVAVEKNDAVSKISKENRLLLVCFK